jgi:hypothetical protein
LRHERLARLTRGEVGLDDLRPAALRQLTRAVLVAAVGGEQVGTGLGERLGDRPADAAARARDDGARAGESRDDYPSTPPANGWRAASEEPRTSDALGSLASARAIDSLVAW